MRSRFDEQLIELNTEMIEMGNQIIRAINEAIEATRYIHEQRKIR